MKCQRTWKQLNLRPISIYGVIHCAVIIPDIVGNEQYITKSLANKIINWYFYGQGSCLKKFIISK